MKPETHDAIIKSKHPKSMKHSLHLIMLNIMKCLRFGNSDSLDTLQLRGAIEKEAEGNNFHLKVVGKLNTEKVEKKQY